MYSTVQNDWAKRVAKTYLLIRDAFWDEYLDHKACGHDISCVVTSDSLEKKVGLIMSNLLSDARREHEKATQWIVGNDTGASSKFIWAVMMGVEPEWSILPYDESDYGRCVRLLQFIPEWQSRLDKVVEKYPDWKEAVEHILATLNGEEK